MTDLKKYLFLFDIDGTLLDCKGDGKSAFISAFHETCGSHGNPEINFLGNIDYCVFLNLYKQFKLPEDLKRVKWQQFKQLYTQKLSGLAQYHQWTLFPDGKESIQFLNQVSNIALVTGNIQQGAKIKLAAFGLDIYFNCGGFGDDIGDRNTLVKSAITASEQHFAKTFQQDNIFLFGDTRIDIDSALANGITPVLIDPKNINRDHSAQWKAHYYSNRLNIQNFLSCLTKKQSVLETTYF